MIIEYLYFIWKNKKCLRRMKSDLLLLKQFETQIFFWTFTPQLKMLKASKTAIVQIRKFSSYKLTGKNFIGNDLVSGQTKCK